MNATNQAPVVPPSVDAQTVRDAPARRHWNSPAFRDVSRDYLRSEMRWSYAVELLLFVALASTAAWPIVTAAISLKQMLR